MRFIQCLICFALGMTVLPLVIIVGENLNIIGYKGIPIVAVFIVLLIYLTGGLLIGLFLPREHLKLISIAFGITPFVWSIVFLFIWGWIRESSSGAIIIPISLIPTGLTYFGARAVDHIKIRK